MRFGMNLLLWTGELSDEMLPVLHMCWKCATGEEMWKERLGGTFSGSLTLVGDKLYTTNEAGSTFVFRANPEKFELLAENKLPGEAFATPTICGGQVFLRVAEMKEGKRQEMVYCVGKK